MYEIDTVTDSISYNSFASNYNTDNIDNATSVVNTDTDYYINKMIGGNLENLSEIIENLGPGSQLIAVQLIGRIVRLISINR